MKQKVSFNEKALWYCFESNPHLVLNETIFFCQTSLCDFQCKVNLGLGFQTLNQIHT